VFILAIPGTAYVAGSLSNAYFVKEGPVLTGTAGRAIDAMRGEVVLKNPRYESTGEPLMDIADKSNIRPIPEAPVRLAEFDGTLPVAGQPARGRTLALLYAGNSRDRIIPTFITAAMPQWFAMLFLLILLAAAMTTLSGQFHTLGTSIGHDVYEQLTGASASRIGVTRIGIILGIVLAVVIAKVGHDGTLIARATAIFFGLCTSAFLPAYVGGLFWRRMTKAGALASMATGFVVTAFWLLLVKEQEAGDLGLVQLVTGGKRSILAGVHNWPVVDPMVVALPLSILAAVVVTLLTRPPDKAHLDRCFAGARAGARG